MATLLAAAVATGGCAPSKEWGSISPPFTVRYPASWHVSTQTNEYGAVTVFSPDAAPGPMDARITLQVTSARPRTPGREGAAPLEMSMETAVPGSEGTLPGHRWFVTVYPAGVLVEACAPPQELDEVRRLAERMVEDIRKTRRDNP